MPKLPPCKSQEILQLLLKNGFYIHHQRGSHARLFHIQRSELRVTIPIHNKELPERTLRYILRQADISEKEFRNLLKK